MDWDFEAWPRVVPAGRETEITLTSLHPDAAFPPDAEFVCRFLAKVNPREDAQLEFRGDGAGVLRCRLPFMTAGEYLLDVNLKGSEKVLTTAYFFAAPPDLLALRPFKGDFHLHTVGSDGKRSAVSMALRARETGLDFLAVSDHDNYPPSVRAAKELESLGLDLLLFTGEEVTARQIGGHFLSLEASAWVGKLRFGDQYDEEVKKIAAELRGRGLHIPFTPEDYAHAVWVVRKIREFGGFAVIAHPYWVSPKRRFYPERALYEQLLADGLYDAVELLGGVTVEDNLLSVARWQQALAQGVRLPIVGCSDAHDLGGLGNTWTMVFAASLNRKSVLDAIGGLKSVAGFRRGPQDLVIHGEFRLVEYAYFLEREFFPLHDRLASAQASLCDARRAGGAAESAAALAALRNDLARLSERFWAKPS